MKETPKEIMEKIQKLLKKSQSAEEIGSKAEAEAFAAKVHELLTQYNISLSDLKDDSQEKISVGEIKFTSGDLFTKNESDWVRTLYIVIAKANYCGVINFHKGNLVIMGKPHNIEITLFIVDQLKVKIRLMAKNEFKTYRGSEKRNTFLRGFYHGAVLGLMHKLEAQKEAQKANYQQITALIRVNDGDITEYRDKKYPSLTTIKVKQKGLSSIGGKEAGYNAGKNMNINKSAGANPGGVKSIG